MATLGKICLDYWPKKMHNGQKYTATTTKEKKAPSNVWMLQINRNVGMKNHVQVSYRAINLRIANRTIKSMSIWVPLSSSIDSNDVSVCVACLALFGIGIKWRVCGIVVRLLTNQTTIRELFCNCFFFSLSQLIKSIVCRIELLSRSPHLTNIHIYTSLM